jgi:hypothetical protein
MRTSTLVAVATEFLNQWERAHDHDPTEEEYRQLGDKLARYTEEIGLSEAADLKAELASQRKARGWPDPTPGTLEPSIEAAIFGLWHTARREHRA